MPDKIVNHFVLADGSVARYSAEHLAGDIPEVVDIRTGYDGTVYESAGDAVRGQVSELHDEIGDFKTIKFSLETGNTGYKRWFDLNLTGETYVLKTVKREGVWTWFSTKVTYSDNTTEGFTLPPTGGERTIHKDGVTIANIQSWINDASVMTEPVNYIGYLYGTENGGLANLIGTAGDNISTIGEEVNGIRTGYDGTAYTSAGDAVRAQVSELHDEVETANNNIANPKISLLSKSKVTYVNKCQTASEWINNVVPSDTPTFDTTNYVLFDGSIHTTSGLQNSALPAIDMVNNDLTLKLKVNSISDGTRLNLYVAEDSSFSAFAIYTIFEGTEHCQYPVGEWFEVSIPYTAWTSKTSTPNFENIKVIRFVPYRSSGAQADFNLQYVGYRKKATTKPIVSFTFDDGYTSQYLGNKILADYGLTGTMYYIKERLGDSNFLTVEQMQEMVNQFGTDIEVHGESDYTAWSEADLVSHWQASQAFLKENGLGDGKHMAYPNGIQNSAVTQLARRFFDSSRTISSAMGIETIPTADNQRLRAVSGISSNNVTVAQTKTLIDKAVQSKSWLILVFHRISTGDAPSSMECSVADLKAIVEYVLASGAEVMNVKEVYDSRYTQAE